MNKRVTKMLYNYAVASNQNIKELKSWWNTLNWRERTEEKRRIMAELDGGSSAGSDAEAAS